MDTETHNQLEKIHKLLQHETHLQRTFNDEVRDQLRKLGSEVSDLRNRLYALADQIEAP